MRTLHHTVFGLLGLALAAGCSSAASTSATGDDQNVVPAAAATLFDQANVCDQLLARHDGVRDQDLKAGILRWDCGDVRGVTNPDRGQEYCEYQAVSNGKAITQASQLPQGSKLSCLFTSVYSDVMDIKGGASATQAYRQQVATALAAPENLGVTTDPKLAVMSLRFNSRGAADALISTCRDTTKAVALDEKSSDVRLAAAFQAVQAGNPNAQQITAIAKQATTCQKDSGGNITHCDSGLADDSTFAKLTALGVKVAQPGDANFERQRDIAACTRVDAEVSPGQTNGVPWRNSDPNICGRVSRAMNDCGTVWPDGALDNVPGGFDGFLFTGWTGTLPAGCRYMKMTGKDYQNVVICDATDQQTASLKFSQNFAHDVQAFCHDTFAANIAMVAPLKAVATKAAGDTTTPFCAEFSGTQK